MVLTDLGRKITSAYSFSKATDINKEVFENMLNQISTSLLQAGVNSRSTEKLKENLRNAVKFDELPDSHIKKMRKIKSAVFQELVKLMNPGVNARQPVKGKSNIIMLVGLQNAGKSTTCMKLAHYYSGNNWKVCIVCTDAVGADQLTEKVNSIGIPLYSSNLKADPIVIAQEGVEKYKKESFEIIIVDTVGSFEEETIFREMLQLSNAVKPDSIMLVVDGVTGVACEDQVKAFREKIGNGSVIVTKLDMHTNAAGTLSAVASTNSPIKFVGTGEGINYFEPFTAQSFVRKLLGMGDIKGLVRKMNQIEPIDKGHKKRVLKGTVTLRDLYETKQRIFKLRPLSEVMRMIPGLSDKYSETVDKVENNSADMLLTILGCMSNEELNHRNGAKLFREQKERITRVADAAGVEKEFVEDAISLYIDYRKRCKLEARIRGMGEELNKPVKEKLRRFYKKMDPEFMQKIGGTRGFSKFLLKMKKTRRSLRQNCKKTGVGLRRKDKRESMTMEKSKIGCVPLKSTMQSEGPLDATIVCASES